jgi:hypothetical protein
MIFEGSSRKKKKLSATGQCHRVSINCPHGFCPACSRANGSRTADHHHHHQLHLPLLPAKVLLQLTDVRANCRQRALSACVSFLDLIVSVQPMAQDGLCISELPEVPRQRSRCFYSALFTFILPLWSLIPLSWGFVIWSLYTGRIWLYRYPGLFLFAVALVEVSASPNRVTCRSSAYHVG